MNFRKQAQDMIRKVVDAHGWAITGDGENLVLYTVGLTGRGLPELLLCGVGPATTATVLNTLAGVSVVLAAPLRPGIVHPVQGVAGVFTVADLPWRDAPIKGGLIRELYPKATPRLQLVTHHNPFGLPPNPN